MINFLIRNTCKLLLGLRYRVELRGVDEIARRGRTGILFLPNHPALIDPVIVMAHLQGPFAPGALADRDQVDRFAVRWVTRRLGVRTIPDIRKYGIGVRPQVEAAIRTAIDDLKRGANLILYPSGHAYRSRFEDLRGNSAVETILREAPEVRVALVRTRGLWGSTFSYAHGVPNVARSLKRAVGCLLANLLFFTPRRRVTIELHEPSDLPRTAGRNEINRYLETFYNQDAPPNTYVPYTIWEGGGPVEQPEPETVSLAGSARDVPLATRQIVRDYLRERTGAESPRDEDQLAHDLGLDSLARADLVVWLGKEFGYGGADVDDLRTVGDVMLAARGEMVVTRPTALKPVPGRWFRRRSHTRVSTPPGETITEVFLTQARRGPGRPAIADQLSGVKTYRSAVLGIMALRPAIEGLEGQHVGIMLPASVGAVVTYLACLFAGKTPVMVNWTTGTRNILHALDSLGVRRVLTAGPLVARIESQGTDLSAVKDRLIPLEDVARGLSRGAKLAALARSRLSWASLRTARVPQTAVVLLTSGSETQPKAVPLTHANLLANLRDVLSVVTIREDDCLIGFLPPFHSFGLTVTVLLPTLAGARTVYHANPTEASMLCQIIAAYKTSVLLGTPTFLAGIVRASRAGQLASLRLAVTGAEKCPERTYAAIADRCPNAVILEGYGISECSPIVAANDETEPRPYTIGKVLPSFESAIVDVDTWQRVSPGRTGLLLVRGPCVFDGYLGEGVESPFVEFDGRQWYRTGDLVSADEDGVLTFRGRLKRFVKIGGEMISLPAVEAALEPHYAGDTDEGPVIAVEATPRETQPELVLFTAMPSLDRQTVNRQIRDAGLSPLHNVSRVIHLESIPVLGTGKTDYRALKQLLADAAPGQTPPMK
ncbi:MAG: AMP-binding protein [Planctomycetes bacterium]|nr:AMP-binding protein [Planctomycetota bacterium]